MNRTTEDLIDAINLYAEDCHDGDLDTDGSYGEYVASVGYGEGWHALDFRDIDDDELVDRLKDLRAKDTKGFKDLICACSYVVPAGIYVKSGEIYSIIIGETEHQLPDDIINDLRALSTEDRAAVERQVDVYMRGDYIYLDHNYKCMVLILDTERAREYLGMEDAE